MFLSRLILPFSRTAQKALLASVILPATMVPGQGAAPSADSHHLAALPLPSGAQIRSSDVFGAGAPGQYYFLERGDRLRLFRLDLAHPMGAQDLWMETWRSIRVPALSGQEHLRTAAVGMQHLFLAGEVAGGAPFIRSYQIGKKRGEGGGSVPTLTGRVDYFPESDTTPIRRLYFDAKSKTLWLAYDSGRIESGRPYLVLHDRILWSDPAGYLPLPDETALSRGPSPLLTPRSLSKASNNCFSCRYYLVSRQEPEGGNRPSLPVRSPENLDSALGILPMGSGLGLFMGRDAMVCRVPHPGPHARLKDCAGVPLKDLPVAASWWGNQLAYLFPPGRFSWSRHRWTIVAINPALIDNARLKLSPGKPFAFRDLLSSSGQYYLLPEGSRPRPKTFFTDGHRLILFGASHLYFLESRAVLRKTSRKEEGD